MGKKKKRLKKPARKAKKIKRIRKKPTKKRAAPRPRRRIAKKPPKKAIVEKPKASIEINNDWCKGCYICVDICPKQVFDISTKRNKLGVHPAKAQRPAQCIVCYECELHCPDMAISVTPVE